MPLSYKHLSKVKKRKKPEQVLGFRGFPYGLNTSVPSSRIEKTECSELINWNIKKGGKLVNRNPIAQYSSGATTGQAAVKTIKGVKIGATNYTLAVDDNYVLYYLDSGLDYQTIGTLEAFTTIIPYNGVAVLLDGSFIKYIDDVSEIKIAYDDGTGTSAYQFDHTSGDDDASLALGNGTNIRIATKFTSQAWETGYTIPPTTVTCCLCKEESPTGSIVMKIRLVADDSILATKTFLADVTALTTTATEYSATFASSDVTTEMSPSTAYYCTLEYAGGDAANYVKVHYSTVAASGTAYHYIAGWNANATKDCLMSLKPGMPPKGQFGAVHESRPFIAGDPDNLGYVWYGNLTHLDWSSSDGGGYIGVVDDNRNNYEVGGIGVLYGNLMVYGTEKQPYLSQLSGGSPTDYILSPLMQNPWTTYKTLKNTMNDLWAGAADGVDPLSGVREYGDFRTFSASDPVADRLNDNWDSDTAFAEYYPLEGQYWLVMPDYFRVLVSHTKIPAKDPSGAGARYPWVEYELYRDILTSSTYKWTLSSGGTNEYYLTDADGNDPDIDVKPDFLILDEGLIEDVEGGEASFLLLEDGGDLLLEGSLGTAMISEGSAGSLADHEWGYGDNDGLGFSTIYFADATGDPDTTDIDIRSVLLPTALASVGSEFLIGGSDGYIYKIDSSEYQDLGEHELSPRLTTAYMEIPFGEANFIQYQLFASSANNVTVDSYFYVSGESSAKDIVASSLTVTSPNSVTDPLLYQNINFNSRAVLITIRNIELGGSPFYLNGIALKYRRMSY